MTDEMMDLRALLEKSSDAELWREMIGFTAQRLMELEVQGVTGAVYGEKDPERVVQRNGYRDAGRHGRRVVAAFIGTAFVQDDAEAARAQWRQVADQLRPKVPKLAAFMDAAETDVLAFMNFPKDHRVKSTPSIRSSDSTARSSGALRSSASSPTKMPSFASSGPCWPNRTTNGRFSAGVTFDTTSR
jgi:transposase-like protein